MIDNEILTEENINSDIELRVLRLYDNYDIIGLCTTTKKHIDIGFPMIINFHISENIDGENKQEIHLIPWLPIEICGHFHTKLRKKDIFTWYYPNSVIINEYFLYTKNVLNIVEGIDNIPAEEENKIFH